MEWWSVRVAGCWIDGSTVRWIDGIIDGSIDRSMDLFDGWMDRLIDRFLRAARARAMGHKIVVREAQ
eukprot:5257054-Lingulodinium_polyedra.AAC.1